MDFKFTQEQLQEIAKSQVETQIGNRIIEELDDFDFKDYIETTLERLVESYFKKKFMDTDNELDEFVMNACKKESWLWIVNNYYKDDMDDLVSKALSEKFSQLDLKDLMEFGKLVMNREGSVE